MGVQEWVIFIRRGDSSSAVYLSMPEPKEVLESIKNWINEEGKYNIIEISNSKNRFIISMFSKKEDSGELPISLVYSRDPDLAGIIEMGWGWKPLDIDIKAYRAIKNSNLKRSLIESVKDMCQSEGLSIIVEPNEDVVEGKGFQVNTYRKSYKIRIHRNTA
jgi:hypothetical protein